MNTYKARVKVHSPSGASTMMVWVQVVASNPVHARQLLEAQYGRGSVVGVAVLA